MHLIESIMAYSFKNWRREAGLPPPIINFLLSWYRKQTMRVQWSYNCLSSSFSVLNGVRQGGVLSHICLQCIWTVCLMSCLSLVLAVIGIRCLPVHFVTPMMLFYWHLALLPFAKCYQFVVPTQIPTVSVSILRKPNLSVSVNLPIKIEKT